MTRTPSILAVADHTGWAQVVCVSARERRPFVVARRRIALIENGLPTQAYEHTTRGMRPREAEALIATVRESVTRTTDRALREVVGDVSREHPVSGLTIRTPPFEELPATVAAVHGSYRLMCAADGMLYHMALCSAAKCVGLDVRLCRRGDEIASAAEALGVTADAVEAFVAGPGRPPGPPWTAEHRRAYAAGIGALASLVRGLTIR